MRQRPQNALKQDAAMQREAVLTYFLPVWKSWGLRGGVSGARKAN
jgi:hypothetical protein